MLLKNFVTTDKFVEWADDLSMRISRDAHIRFARKCGLKTEPVSDREWKMSGNRFQFIRYYFGGPGTERSMDRVKLFMSRNPK